jgi:hypothetical protein
MHIPSAICHPDEDFPRTETRKNGVLSVNDSEIRSKTVSRIPVATRWAPPRSSIVEPNPWLLLPSLQSVLLPGRS